MEEITKVTISGAINNPVVTGVYCNLRRGRTESGMAILAAALLGIALVIGAPVLEELFLRILE